MVASCRLELVIDLGGYWVEVYPSNQDLRERCGCMRGSRCVHIPESRP